ncbi:hypothetical protein [Acetobacter senegalensis]|uniref:hypothetical protein n=1 Tax=Acetobacter senegalensis TaxID=446692 RepID=UPI001ED9C70F|nr:hypothetical protein [Acetobacter senegalensis]MCG4258186.1 hypothetical protein [Acetobacter senegalensis]MCG4268113.1 hypothetical protein [Acetobacter senegalensis]
MTTIAKIQPGAVALPVAPADLSADLSALIAAVQRGVPMTARDLTPSLVSEARAIADSQAHVAPAPEIIIAAWVKKLIPLTVNPPTDPADSAAKISAICEICGDMPAAVWTPETRKAWITQGPQGKFWPSPAELYAHLQPYADKICRNVEGCRRIVRLAERAGKREEGVSAEERAAVARQMAEWRKSMGHEDAGPERRRPVEPQPSTSERLAECHRQLAADPAQAVWLQPLIAQLEAQVVATCGKEPQGRAHSASQVFSR